MRNRYAIYSLDKKCVMCKTPLVGVDRLGNTYKDIDGMIYNLNYLICPKCRREYFIEWITSKEIWIPRSYETIDQFVNNLSSKIQ